MFYSPEFTPNYSPVFSDPELEANASTICGDDLFCLFDIAATGRIDIGMATLQGGINFNILVELSKPGQLYTHHRKCILRIICAHTENILLHIQFDTDIFI